jgi:hypothetical protein
MFERSKKLSGLDRAVTVIGGLNFIQKQIFQDLSAKPHTEFFFQLA